MVITLLTVFRVLLLLLRKGREKRNTINNGMERIVKITPFDELRAVSLDLRCVIAVNGDLVFADRQLDLFRPDSRLRFLSQSIYHDNLTA